MAEPRNRWHWLIALGVVLALLGVVFASQNPLTRSAQGYAEDIAKASAATYLSLRTVNAFLSTAQEVELGGSLVVSGTARPLKVLEPIDDTIERIAGVVFVVMVTTGLLAVAMGPVGGIGWALILVAGLVWMVPGRAGHGLARAIGAYGAFLALALPLAFMLSSALSGAMTAQVWDRNEAVIGAMTDGLGVTDPGAVQDEGWFQGMRDQLGGMDRYRTLAANIYENADALIGSYIAILAVYLFKVFLLPLMLAGGFFILARRIADNRL